ncbi:MAG: hypothetical protein BRC58_10085 [Cyanobacteria bacterium QS_8_64_29]|nr:MAG: hypothetical protein BRC58_10085 [Cyanobacteria bacterium QS_8_64_29]
MTSPQNPNQILIVEDELILAKRVARQLEQQGYGIADICTTGQAALEHFERCQPNLVLMDIALPGEWDGIEAAARIRERADIPLIYLTAYADDATLARAEATGGACGYLTKPYRECELRTTVKMALTQHQVRQRERTQAQQAHQAQLEELTHGDGITGLPNQLALHEQFARLLADRGEGTTLPVLCLHLDRGRALEATFGTGTQNTLTQNAAQRLQAQVSERDLLASLGEGQFAVVVGDGRAGPERAQHLLACLNRLTALAGQEVALTASAGLAHYPDNGTQLDGLLAQASQAAERAAAGGNQYRHAQPQQAAASRDRLALETALRYALDRQQFQLHYQPRIALATGQTVGAEALLRWLHPEWGNIPPGRFIPIAEETGTILEIGEWVARTASRQLQAWNQRLRHPLALAVNLSGRQFESEQLVQQLAALGQPPLCSSWWARACALPLTISARATPR